MATSTLTTNEKALIKERDQARKELEALKKELGRQRDAADKAKADADKVKAEAKKKESEAEAEVSKLRKEIESLKASKPAAVNDPAPAAPRAAGDLAESPLLSTEEAGHLRRALSEAYVALEEAQNIARKERGMRRIFGVDLS